MDENIVKFKVWRSRLVFATYQHGNGTAMRLVHAVDGSKVATCTINLNGLSLPYDEVVIKDYNENEGMLDALINAGIVEDMGVKYKVGFVEVPRCKLTAKALAIRAEQLEGVAHG